MDFIRAGRYLGAVLIAGTLTVACNRSPEAVQTGSSDDGASMNSFAEQYVRLTLAVGRHDADYVDAYYGPPEWKPVEEKAALDDFRKRAAALLQQVASRAEPADDMDRLRHQYLKAQLSAMNARLGMLK